MKRVSFFLAVAFCMFGASVATYAQVEDDVVVNEFAVNPTAGKEYIELLVTKPGGINMQGWTVSDVSTRAGGTAATEGDITLPAASYLGNVPQGTYVVIVLTTPAANINTLPEDTSLADGNGRLVLIAGSTAGVISGGTLDNATADNVQVYAGTRAVGTLIDQVLVGTNTTSFIPGATWGDNNGATTADNINAGVAMPSNSIARFVPLANTLAGFQDNDTGVRFVVDAGSYGTPGLANTAVTDSAVTNPSYSTGNVDPGSFNGLNITGNVGLAGNVTVYGTMTISSGIVTTGVNTLTIDCGGLISGASPTTYVDGNLKKNYCASGVKGFEVGTANGYSPVSVTISAATFPTDFTVKAVQGPQPNLSSPQYALQRYWTLSAPAGVTADLNFNYLDPTDIPVTAIENNFVILKYSGSFTMPGGTVSPGTNQASISGVTSFSDWTLAQPNAPTAGSSRISGIVTRADGQPLGGVTVNLSGSQSARTITDGNGQYHFSDVDTNGFYTVTPGLANYSFSPSSRSFSLVGNKTDATFTGTEDSSPSENPVNANDFFVRQQYLDFLGREPDQQGWLFWTEKLNQCGQDANCVRQKRIDISAAFFQSDEFQLGGNFVYRLYRAGLGRRLTYAEFSDDRQLVIGGPGLEASRTAFADSFVQRPEFAQKYQSANSAESFVDALLQTVRLDSGMELAGRRDSLIRAYNSGADSNHSRAAVLKGLAETSEYQAAVYNASFVLTEYFGYLQRSPDPQGYDFWVAVLNESGRNGEVANYRGMVCSFLTSTEYQRRFSPVILHGNNECGQ